MMDFPLTVQVLEVDSQGYAHVRDELGSYKVVTTAVQRAKGEPPRAGETWIIDRALGGQWTFAAIVNPSLNTGKAGIVEMYAGIATEPPEGYLWCDGSTVDAANYPELFSVIGNTYGYGVGSGMQLQSGTGWYDTDNGTVDELSATVSPTAGGEVAIAVVVVNNSNYNPPVTDRVYGLGVDPWTKLIEIDIPERWGVHAEVWAADITGIAATVYAKFDKPGQTALRTFYVDSGYVSDIQVLNQTNLTSPGRVVPGLTTTTATDLIFVTGLTYLSGGLLPVNSTGWSQHNGSPLTIGSNNETYMADYYRTAEGVGKIPEPWLLSDPSGFAMLGLVVSPDSGSEPGFVLPDIPDASLNGFDYRYMISTGRHVSLFGTD